MARNGSGTMSITNSFTANTTIESSAMNANFTDVASEITNSLPRDGQAAMTGVLKIAAGTAAAPGLSISTDTDSGIYRIGANNLGMAAGGSMVAQWDSTGLKDATGENYDAFDAGTSMLFYQASAPTGWTDAGLTGDYGLRVVPSGGTGGTGTAGSPWSTTLTSRTIAQANLPSVNFTVTATAASDGAHQHYQYNTTSTGSASNIAASTYPIFHYTTGEDGYLTKGTATAATLGLTSSNGAHTHSVSGTAASGGSGTALDFAVSYYDVIIATKD